VLGHSMGEYVAACTAGIFSLEDGLGLIVERARLMHCATREGRMAAVLADEPLVLAAVERFAGDVSLAAFNGPQDFVVSGTSPAMRDLCDELEAQGGKTRMLNIDCASHSPWMEAMLPAFEQVVSEVAYQRPQTRIVSNVTGEIEAQRMACPEYWLHHLRRPVRFSAGLESLRKEGYRLFLEVGPRPILLGMAARNLSAGAGAWLPSLRPERSDERQMLESLARLYVLGASPDWEGFYRGARPRRARLPTYPFQRQRYALGGTRGEAPQPADRAGRSAAGPRLARRLERSGSTDRRSILREHVRSLVAGVLGFDSGKRIPLRRGFSDLGVDSLMAVELRNRLESDLGRSLPSTLLIDHPTVERLAEHLLPDVAKAVSASSPRRSPTPKVPVALDELSESEAEAFLIEELEKINH